MTRTDTLPNRQKRPNQAIQDCVITDRKCHTIVRTDRETDSVWKNPMGRRPQIFGSNFQNVAYFLSRCKISRRSAERPLTSCAEKKLIVLQTGWKRGRVGKQRWWSCHLWLARVDWIDERRRDWLMLQS